MGATAYRKVSMVNTPWDAGENVKHLRENEKASYYESAFMYYIDGKDPTKKSSYKLPYMEVAADGDIMHGNIQACRSILGVLNGAMGGVDIPEADKDTIRNNATRHLKDAGIKVTKSVYKDGHIPKSAYKSNSVSIDVAITKTTDEGLVSGWASVSLNKDGSIPLDWQGDIIRPETLEKAAAEFMQDYRESGVMHQGMSQGTVVESIVFTKDKQKALGIPEGIVPEGWFITVKINNPETFAKVKAGKYKMFSIQGHGKRLQI